VAVVFLVSPRLPLVPAASARSFFVNPSTTPKNSHVSHTPLEQRTPLFWHATRIHSHSIDTFRLDKPSSSHHFQAQSEHARTLQRDGVAPAHPTAAGRLPCPGRARKRLALCPLYLVFIRFIIHLFVFPYLLCVHGWVLHYQ
jgi:hypothetical protein